MTPQEQQALYEANANRIAEEMAQQDDPYGYRMVAEVEYSQEAFEGFMNKYKSLARIALKHMAEEFSNGWRAKPHHSTDLYEPHLKVELQSRGLVPVNCES